MQFDSPDPYPKFAIQRLKTFLGEPFSGYIWKFEEGLETQWKAPIVRGILGELDLWHSLYKPNGWTHLPEAQAVDFVKGVEAVQLKTIGSAGDGVISRMKEAIDALITYADQNSKTALKLDIRHKPSVDTTALLEALENHLDGIALGNKTFEINITAYDFIPKP